MAGQVEENPYGPHPELGKAPEAIARTVASLAPEKMFEMMKTMKETVNNNPQMARILLIENPQLSYALLQAQVVMRVVDPKVAYSMLHRENPINVPFHQQTNSGSALQSAVTAPSLPQQMSFSPTQQILPSSSLPTSSTIPVGTNVGVPQIPMFSHPPPHISTILPGSGTAGLVRPSVTVSTSGLFPPVVCGAGTSPPFGTAPTLHSVVGGQQPFQTASPSGLSLGAVTAGLQPHQLDSKNLQQPQQLTSAASSQQQQHQDSSIVDEEQQAQMLVKVLQLTDEQIRMLPPEDRVKVIELRNQLRQQVSSST